MGSSVDNIYVLWDESHLWGVMLTRALREMEIPFKVIDSKSVRNGILEHKSPCGILVPGGWARLKARSLGPRGMEAVKTYLHSGGRYLGFCGGAGLALKSTPACPSLNLCPWGRKPLKDRLPNFSGHVLSLVKTKGQSQEHKLFLPVWWPSQFEPCPDSGQEVTVLARYLEPGKDFWSSDLDLAHIQASDIHKWEHVYGINLNPDSLSGQPCIIRGSFGQGRYILSYSHLETPDSPQANRLLASILREWLHEHQSSFPDKSVPGWNLRETVPVWEDETLLWARNALDELISHGRNQFLLFWRSPWLLGWSRGIPGAHINFLYAMICHALECRPKEKAQEFWAGEKNSFQQEMEIFLKELKHYLCHERLAISLNQSSPEASSDDKLQQKKKKLFGSFPGYGGYYGKLIQSIDQLVFRLM